MAKKGRYWLCFLDVLVRTIIWCIFDVRLVSMQTTCIKRTQIQFPDPLYDRLKQVAEFNDWPLAEVVRRATEIYVQRFPEIDQPGKEWTFPVIDVGGDFIIDPAQVSVEGEVMSTRAR